jgi:putative ABC transport system permease protein
MNPLVRIGGRHFLRHRAQLALAVFGVGIGVAAVVAIGLANESASRAFDLSVDSLSGRATHRVLGGPGGLAEDIHARLRTELRVDTAAPVIEGTCRAVLADDARRPTLRILGIDPLAEAPLRPHLGAFGGRRTQLDVGRLMAEPGAVVVTSDTARALGASEGEPLTLEVAGFAEEVRVIGILQPEDRLAARGLDHVLITDVSTAQDLLRRPGELDRIDVRVDEGAVDALAAALGDRVRIEPAERQRGVLRDLTRAFRTNLEAMGMLALLVGAFLIHNTMRFAVVQRRPLFGIARALGATPRQVFTSVLGEALILGSLATILGLGLGIGLAHLLLGLVARTIEDFYFSMSVRELTLDASILAEGTALGLAACVVAALLPAREAVRVPAREAIHRAGAESGTRLHHQRSALVGIALLAAGIFLLWIDDRSISLAYTGILLVLLAITSLTPWCTRMLLRAAAWPLRRCFGGPGRYAAQSAIGSLSRTGLAVTALMLAVAAAIGLGAMIQAFRGTVSTWLGTALAADVYVTVPAAMSERTAVRMDTAALSALTSLSEVGEASTYRRVEVLDDAGRTLELAAVGASSQTVNGLTILEGTADAARAALQTGNSLLISEPLAWRLDLGVGDTITLKTGRSGEVEIPIAAVFRDYAAERGWAMLARARYDELFDDPAITSIALWAAEGSSVDDLLGAARRMAERSEQRLAVQASQGLREASLEIFDRTFAITAVLRLLCLVVAGLGVFSALSALQLDRRREIGALRAIGATPRQVSVILTGQNLLLGVCAGILAIPTGLILAWLLAAVVNRRSFGWTLLEFEFPPGVAVEALVTAAAAACVAGIWPSLRMSRVPLAAALRDE